MSYIILYFSIGLALAIVVYLYSCYEYRVNYKQWSWERYTDTHDVHGNLILTIIGYPLFIIMLSIIGLTWCIGYIAECVREWIFKIIDQHFVK